MRIGTRGSALALWQARTVAQRLADHGAPAPDIVVIRTSGDETAGPPDAPRPAAPVGTGETPNLKRAFVKEIEDALLGGRIDLAVHSAKDLPAVLPDGLRIAGALAREDPHDALVLPAGIDVRGLDHVLAALGETPRIGTSSVRRGAEFRRARRGAEIVAIRGNVDTRLRKLDAGDCDALLLAAAGLRRLGLEARISALVPAAMMIPAPGQGIVVIECAETLAPERVALVAAITDADAMTALIAERAVVTALGGDCRTPLGALATVEGQTVTLHASVVAPDGRRAIRGVHQGRRGNPAAIGEHVAAQLLARGAGDILSPHPPK
jgi:hydroxymethylbilane synthase